MKIKTTLVAGVAAVAGAGIMPAAAYADPTPYTVTACDETSCTVYQCATLPNINDSGFDGYGCSVLYRYPRPREVSGD
jgi:hypothetical protein